MQGRENSEGFVLSLNTFYYTVYHSKSCFDTGIIENTS